MKNCEENYVSAEFFETPVLVGNSYDKWYQLFDWDEINESARRRMVLSFPYGFVRTKMT